MGSVNIKGIIGEDVFINDVQKEIDEAKKDGEITVHLSTQGGGVYEGMAIYDALKAAGVPITVNVEGVCMSIGTYIASAADPGKLYTSETSRHMIHMAATGPVGGGSAELRASADELDRIEELYIKVVGGRSGIPGDVLLEMMRAETFMSADEAVKSGLADDFIEDLKPVMLYDPEKANNFKPNKQKEMDENKMQSLLSRMERFLGKAEPKMLTMTLQETDEQVYINTEDINSLEGKTVYKSKNGSSTNEKVEDGKYKFKDDEHTVQIKDGKIEKAYIDTDTKKEKEEEEKMKKEEEKEVMQALKESVEMVKEMRAEMVKQNQEREELSKKHEKLQEEITMLKNQTPAHDVTPPAQTYTSSQGAQMSAEKKKYLDGMARFYQNVNPLN